ncbi:hypothetical protein WJX74_002621 [Apatococcus lobatus]|uniref:Uncharacterized protein n=1 Tax=Apatococcus lobatus TaxID=904363 RepID=A0AAW1QIK3_9CHLO
MGKLSSSTSGSSDSAIAKLAWFARWHALAQERCTQEHAVYKLQDRLAVLTMLPMEMKEANSQQKEDSHQLIQAASNIETDLGQDAQSLQQGIAAAHEAICRDKTGPDLTAPSKAAATRAEEIAQLLQTASRALEGLEEETCQFGNVLHLMDMRLSHCHDQLLADVVWRLEAQSKAAESGRLQKLHADRMQRLKQELAVYKERLKQHEAEAAARAAEQEQDLAIQEAESSKQRQKRIAFRETRRQQHLQQLNARYMKDKEAALQLEQRLFKLADKVASQHQARADFERLCHPTQAMLKPAMERRQIFAPMHGFSTQEIVKDQRFRAMEAIRQHGIAMTPYACQTLLSAKPSSASRPDNFTSPGGLQL